MKHGSKFSANLRGKWVKFECNLTGLGTLSEKTQEMRLRAAAEGDEQPRDFHERQKEKEAWARSVGWR